MHARERNPTIRPGRREFLVMNIISSRMSGCIARSCFLFNGLRERGLKKKRGKNEAKE